MKMLEQVVFVVATHDGIGHGTDAMVYGSLEAAQIGVIGGIDKVLREGPEFWSKEFQRKYNAFKRSHKWTKAIALFKREEGLSVIKILKRKVQRLDEETMAFVIGSAQEL